MGEFAQGFSIVDALLSLFFGQRDFEAQQAGNARSLERNERAERNILQAGRDAQNDYANSSPFFDLNFRYGDQRVGGVGRDWLNIDEQFTGGTDEYRRYLADNPLAEIGWNPDDYSIGRNELQGAISSIGEYTERAKLGQGELFDPIQFPDFSAKPYLDRRLNEITTESMGREGAARRNILSSGRSLDELGDVLGSVGFAEGQARGLQSSTATSEARGQEIESGFKRADLQGQQLREEANINRMLDEAFIHEQGNLATSELDIFTRNLADRGSNRTQFENAITARGEQGDRRNFNLGTLTNQGDALRQALYQFLMQGTDEYAGQYAEYGRNAATNAAGILAGTQELIPSESAAWQNARNPIWQLFAMLQADQGQDDDGGGLSGGIGIGPTGPTANIGYS